MLGRLAIISALAATASVVHASDVGEFTRPVCGEAARIVVAVPANKRQAVNEVLERLQAAGKGGCVQRGPIAGTWVLEGNRNAMLVGILPVGVDEQPYLQVFTPYQLLGPLKVDVVKADGVVSNNTN
ncbi:hypothetical protein ACG04R_16520 [Roseateles sp. BYS78W]|uniref:Uncharacterized protein n=1 Tax=Pelomonas candidula TaxID=3299025 RepID=A0ABW7HEF0_9BURK